jgi:predicted nuclease of predicted toxin-antitoxin system
VRWLIDEMLPPSLADELNSRGHDALDVRSAGLAGTSDEEVYSHATEDERTIVTENFADYAVLAEGPTAPDEPTVVVVFVRKSSFPAQGLAHHLAAHLDAWAQQNPEPFAGVHWP